MKNKRRISISKTAIYLSIAFFIGSIIFFCIQNGTTFLDSYAKSYSCVLEMEKVIKAGLHNKKEDKLIEIDLSCLNLDVLKRTKPIFRNFLTGGSIDDYIKEITKLKYWIDYYHSKAKYTNLSEITNTAQGYKFIFLTIIHDVKSRHEFLVDYYKL